MAVGTPAEPLAVPVVRERTSAKVLRWLAKTPVQILLVVVGVAWLIPTIGLFLTSVMPPDVANSKGWWNIISHPSLFTWENYRAIFNNNAITSSLLTTTWIAIGGTVLPILVASMAAYAFAWLEFPGRDWLFVFVIALLGVDQHETFDEPSPYQRPLAIALGALLFLQVVVLAGHHWATGEHHVLHSLDTERSGNVKTLATSLFTDYIWAFEMTAVLLVIAVVGGVALARRSGQRSSS